MLNKDIYLLNVERFIAGLHFSLYYDFLFYGQLMNPKNYSLFFIKLL